MNSKENQALQNEPQKPEQSNSLKDKIQFKHFFQPKLKTMAVKERESDFGFVLGYN